MMMTLKQNKTQPSEVYQSRVHLLAHDPSIRLCFQLHVYYHSMLIRLFFVLNIGNENNCCRKYL